AVFEKQTEKYVSKKSNQVIDPKDQLSVLAITCPILYALIDGSGTFADGIYLDELKLISEDSALIAYELTFLIGGIISYGYVRFVKKESFHIFKERDKGFAAILETTGQFFYFFAM